MAYHKTLASEGKLIRSAAEEPKGDGWVDTPAAFEEGYVKPAPAAPSSHYAPGRKFEAYPTARYNRAGDCVIVKSKDEEDSLKGEWLDTPPPEPASAPAAPDTSGQPTADDVAKLELHATPVNRIGEAIAAVSDLAMLDKIRGYEEANPKGARATVLKALDQRLDELTKPAK